MTGFFTLGAPQRQMLLGGIIFVLSLLLFNLFFRLKLVVVEEAHQVPLPWLQSDLAGEGADSELLDDLENVNLTVELRICVLV